jgi:RNA polymerase sigma-70 factor (ECF subfamily)
VAAGDAAAANGEAPGAALERRDELARLEAALAELAEVARTAFLRFHRDGAGLQEIADEMGLPLNTVKSHVRRARLRLAQRLRGDA